MSTTSLPSDPLVAAAVGGAVVVGGGCCGGCWCWRKAVEKNPWNDVDPSGDENEVAALVGAGAEPNAALIMS